MKRLLIVALLLVASPFATATAARADDTVKVAPADRYFGRMHMSILGIRNYLKDLAQKAVDHPEQADDLFPRVVLVEEAMHDWQVKFPGDPWIPRFTYQLAQLYKGLATDEARTHMNETMEWLISKYPTSNYSAMAP